MRSSFLYIGIASVLVIGIVFWQWKHPTTVTPARGEVAVTISYVDDGYVPSEVTIRKGQAVRWVNDASGDMWPASAVHPTHSLYPGKNADDCLGSSFDACQGLPRGSSWDYTFTHVGEWRFHDHIRPSKTGVVNVIE